MDKAEVHGFFIHIVLIFATTAIAVTPVAASSSSSKSPSRDMFATCLGAAGVLNFTILSSSSSSSESNGEFDRVLNFSIQNLRFMTASPDHRKPDAIVLPGTKAEIRAAVLCCRHSNLTIRIRSGGHSYEGLSYSAAAAFAVIDLMNMNRVRIDIRRRTAWVEAGATLGQTYYAIATATADGGLGFSAGSCPTVGIGGHIAGGGFGLMSRKYGLAADNVADAVMVAADGRVLDRASMGEDVFWAIRGGGGGAWGAVYAWKIRLLAVPELVTGFVLNVDGGGEDDDLVAELVHKWQLVAPALPDDFYLSVFVGAGLPERQSNGVMSATFKGFYLGPKSEALGILNATFPELTEGLLGRRRQSGRRFSIISYKEMNWVESIVFFSGLSEGSTVSDLTDRLLREKNYFKAKSDYVRVPISREGLAAAMSLLKEEPRAYVILDPYGGAMGRAGADRLPFPHRGANLYSIQHMIEWHHDDAEDECVRWIRGFYDHMTPYVSDAPRAAYINYLDLDLGTSATTDAGDRIEAARVWGEKYFLGNFDRLVRVKTLIDPENVFNNPLSIPPEEPAVRLLQRAAGLRSEAN